MHIHSQKELQLPMALELGRVAHDSNNVLAFAPSIPMANGLAALSSAFAQYSGA